MVDGIELPGCDYGCGDRKTECGFGMFADLYVGNREAQKEVQNIALDNNFSIPGDPGFPLNQVRLSPSPSHTLHPLTVIADVQRPRQSPRSRNPQTIPHASTTGTSKQVTSEDI